MSSNSGSSGFFKCQENCFNLNLLSGFKFELSEQNYGWPFTFPGLLQHSTTASQQFLEEMSKK